jgi:conjugal transfer pilus assembly protein TraW
MKTTATLRLSHIQNPGLLAVLVLACIFFWRTVSAEVIGPVYPIAEQDLIAWMKARLAAKLTPDKLAEMNRRHQEALYNYSQEPYSEPPPRATENATRWFDPSIVVPYDLRNHEGRLIHPAGTKANPLDYRALNREILFFNANDSEQLAFASRYAETRDQRLIPILVAGSPPQVRKLWNRQVYFDQMGLLVQKLGIKNVPAIVRQDGRLLRIEEIAVTEEIEETP